MKIAVNTRFLLHNKLEGLGWFTHETLRRMVVQHPDVEFTFLFDRPYHPSFVYAENVTPLVVPPPARHPVLWYAWFELAVPLALRRIQPDLFLSTDGFASLNSSVRQTLVIHDIAFEHYPEDVGRISAWYYKHYGPRYAQRADRIATVSEFTRQDVHEQYGIPLNKMDVVGNGVNDLFRPLDALAKDAIRRQYTNGAPFILTVGAMHPRKNLARLLKAFDQFRNTVPGVVKLVMVGRKAWQASDIEQAYEQMAHKDDVIFTGRLGPEALRDLFASAQLLAYVSVFEGFGIPIIEAQASGTAVLTSATSSMPEVAGEGAHLADPFSVESIARGIAEVMGSDSYQRELVRKGHLNVQRYSWQKSADQLWETMQRSSLEG